MSATRGTAKRALAAGQEISGDDTIETGPSSNVRIVLAHNNATWELGPNKKQLVSESLAWRAPKQDSPAAKVDEATLAAGRHAERETVTTTNTAPAPAAPTPAAAAAPPAQDPAPPAPGGPGDLSPKGGEGGGEGGGGSPQPVMGKANAEKRPKVAKPAADVSDEMGAVGGNTDKKMSKGARTFDTVTADSDDAVAPAEKEVMEPEVVVKHRLAELRSTLGACLPSASLEVVVVVKKGITSFELPAGSSAEVANCFRTAAAKIKFPESFTLRVKTSVVK